MAWSPVTFGLTPDRREDAFTVALGLLVLIACLVEHLSAVETVGLLLLAVPLRWRTGRSLEVLGVVLGGILLYLALATNTPVVVLPLFAALYSVAAHGTRRRTLHVALAVLPATLLISLLVSSDREDVPGLLAQMSQVGFALALGEAVRTQRALIGALRERAERAERDRDLEARRRVDEERVRIARDVHDAVAHSIATISTQASVAVHVGRDDPARGLEVVESIKSVSTQALNDLRHALGALREGPSGGPTDRTPSLRDVPRLVEQARAAGLRVTVVTRGGAEGLPAALQVAVYRIVQEALTNVMRHARGSAVTVAVTIGEGEVEVSVADDGRGSPTAASAAGTGSGLDGMRERTRALGGTFEAGATRSRGFRVRAVLPLEREIA